MRAKVAAAIGLVSVVVLDLRAHAQDGGVSPTSPWLVYDVTNPSFSPPGVVIPSANCAQNRAAINAALVAASEGGGGTVYMPPGQYCVDDEILGYGNVTLRGAAMAHFTTGAATRIYAAPGFGANKAVIRAADRSIDNYGFEVEDIGIIIQSSSSGIIGVDFSGVWFGGIRGVSVNGAFTESRDVLPDTIGFLFSDRYFNGASGACYGNLVERTSVDGMETAYRFDSQYGTESLITMTSFWVSDTKAGIWTSSIGGVGLTLRDGYMVGYLPDPDTKAFKHTGLPGTLGATITTMNVQFEFFNAPSDLPISSGELTQVWGDLYIGGNITGTNSMTTNGPISGGSLTVTGNVSSGGNISGHNVSLTADIYGSADVSAATFTRSVRESPGYHCGAVASCPCYQGLLASTYAPPYSMSFWAAISGPRPSFGAPGTTLHAGANTFRFYTNKAITQDTVLPDLFFTFHPTHTANIGQVFQMSGTNTKACPAGAWTQAYDVTIFVANEVTLDSDFVFFLEANQTKADTEHQECLFPGPASVPTTATPSSCP